MPRSVVTKSDVRAARPVVARDEPPDVPVEVPARMDEHVVHADLDAVPFDPGVVSVAIVPIPMHPNPTWALLRLLVARSDLRRRRRLCRGGDGRWLRHHEHCLSLELGRRSRFGFQYRVSRGLDRIHRAADSAVAIVSHVELVARLAGFVSARPLIVVGGRRRMKS